ncbi:MULTISPECIES: DUF5703 family protein [unclassified Janibacter]|uniref:DUF5703 family protein n=1 Tax=unclassified Janibacter TaxID=2649294 RepID=UPI003CFD0D2D
MIEYEFRTLRFPRGTSRNEIRRALVDEAEYGHWELDSTTVYVDGSQRSRLRRRIIRVPRAPAGAGLSRSR